jgi:hypothetical protein
MGGDGGWAKQGWGRLIGDEFVEGGISWHRVLGEMVGGVDGRGHTPLRTRNRSCDKLHPTKYEMMDIIDIVIIAYFCIHLYEIVEFVGRI